jgi:hypothetical protein
MKVLTKKEIISSLKIVILAIVLSVGVSQITAWTGPQNAPPGCISGQVGCDAPIHVGNLGQIKYGGLTVGQGLTEPSQVGLFVDNGRVAIGNLEDTTGLASLDVGGQIRIRGGATNANGTIGAGQVLTAVGESGLAQWQDPVAGSGGGIGGSGSVNRVPKFNSGGVTLGDSLIHSASSGSWVNVFGSMGVGYSASSPSAPTATLEVKGDLKVAGAAGNTPSSGKVLMAKDNTGQAEWQSTSTLCPNNNIIDSRCAAAASNNGTGNGTWRAMNCVQSGGNVGDTLASSLLRWDGGANMWKWYNWGASPVWQNCSGSVLIIRIGA